MDWAEIDSLLWLFVVLKLIDWLARTAVAWMGAKGWLPDTAVKGTMAFLS